MFTILSGQELIDFIDNLEVHDHRDYEELLHLKDKYVDKEFNIESSKLHKAIFEKLSSVDMFWKTRYLETKKQKEAVQSYRNNILDYNKFEYRILYFKDKNNYKLCKVYFDKTPIMWVDIDTELKNFDEIINITEAKNKPILYGDFDFPKEYIPK